MKNLKNNWITKDQDTRLYQIPVPIIGLTGGIATGKSTVAQLFREAQIAVIDADQLVKSIYNKKEAHDFVSLHFNEAVENNIINFKKLRVLAFKNQTNQSLIENFIYSYLPQQFLEEYNKLSPQNFIIYDVPLLFEKKIR